MAMASTAERVEHVDCHSVEVCEREHIDYAVAWLKEMEMVEAEAYVAPQAAVREHDALGCAGGAGSVVYQSEFAGRFTDISNVFRLEVVREFLAEKRVDVVSGLRELFAAREGHPHLRDEERAHEGRKQAFVEVFPDGLVHEKELGVGMVDEVVYHVGLELMQYGHGYHPGRKACQ